MNNLRNIRRSIETCLRRPYELKGGSFIKEHQLNWLVLLWSRTNCIRSRASGTSLSLHFLVPIGSLKQIDMHPNLPLNTSKCGRLNNLAPTKSYRCLQPRFRVKSKICRLIQIRFKHLADHSLQRLWGNKLPSKATVPIPSCRTLLLRDSLTTQLAYPLWITLIRASRIHEVSRT